MLNQDTSRRSGLNATEVISYQYLGMSKIAGALNMLPKTILDEIITNDSTNDVMEKFVLASIKLNLSAG
jgi:hypothetical protein